MIFVYPKIGISLSTEGVPFRLVNFVQKKPAEVDCCKSWSLCVANHIISTAEKFFIPFPCSKQVFFTIYLFFKATIYKEEWRVSNLNLTTEAKLVILVHFIFDRFTPLPLLLGPDANPF